MILTKFGKVLSNVFGILFFLLIACNTENKKESEKESEKTEVTSTIISRKMSIVEVVEFEGHSYILNYHGGIIHSESCKCKTIK